MHKWGLAKNDKYECREVQDEKHVFVYMNFNGKHVDEMNNNAIYNCQSTEIASFNNIYTRKATI